MAKVAPFYPPSHTTFSHDDLVHKKSGSQWHGRICGWYATNNNPEGYVVESVYEPGSVQAFPARALELKGDTLWDRFPQPAPPVTTASIGEESTYAPQKDQPSSRTKEPSTSNLLGDAPSATLSGFQRKRDPLPKADALGHRTRFSDSSLYDEKCLCCGGTDAWGDNSLTKPCPRPDGWDRRFYFDNSVPEGYPTACPHCRHKFFCREEHHPQDRPIIVVDRDLDRQVAWKCPKCHKEWSKFASTPNTL